MNEILIFGLLTTKAKQITSAAPVKTESLADEVVCPLLSGQLSSISVCLMLSWGLFSEFGEKGVYLELGQLRKIEKRALQGVAWSLFPVSVPLWCC